MKILKILIKIFLPEVNRNYTCYLAAPKPALCHWRGKFNQQVPIAAQSLTQPDGHWKPRHNVGS